MNNCGSFRGFITCTNQQSDHFPGLLRSSVGRGLYQYRRGHGFNSRIGLHVFQALFSLHSGVHYSEDHSHIQITVSQTHLYYRYYLKLLAMISISLVCCVLHQRY